MKIVIPNFKLPSLANLRLHWRAMDRLKSGQKQLVWAALRGVVLPPMPVVVLITRVGKRRLDSDNLAISAKYTRDEIARAFGVDDGSDLYEWRYAQRIGPYAVEIEIESRVEK